MCILLDVIILQLEKQRSPVGALTLSAHEVERRLTYIHLIPKTSPGPNCASPGKGNFSPRNTLPLPPLNRPPPPPPPEWPGSSGNLSDLCFLPVPIFLSCHPASTGWGLTFYTCLVPGLHWAGAVVFWSLHIGGKWHIE